MLERRPEGAAEPLLDLVGLRKRFGGLAVTDDVTLDLAQGEIHALIGPNGAGKTTLIHQVSGTLRPDAGRVVFAGRDVTALPLAGAGPEETERLVALLERQSGV